MYQDFLPLVSKPARYINTEINAVHKDLTKVKTKICLLFPDTYEVGMSHLGLRILYHILNSREDTACERVFSPWSDYEDRLRSSKKTLTSLESGTPLAEFDILGITLQYELSYSNILAALDMAGIPLRRADRSGRHPLIIAGGPCAVNPGPLSTFVDAFFIGEAEEAIHELIDLEQQKNPREEFLHALSGYDGFYVPGITNQPVRRRIIENIDAAPFPSQPVLPLMRPVHDRVTVEIARGCIRGCRFCQAGMIYRPYRERSPETIKSVIAESLQCTGYDELSLSSLSSGDYSEIEGLMEELIHHYKEDRVSVSLPSLRIGTLTRPMIRAIASIRKTGFTMAPEAATERLRCVINKPVSERDLMETAQIIFANGWNVLKLYFMIGLPTEREEDLDGIARLCMELSELGKKVSRRPVQLNVTVSTFVPKPHTPFQWFGQAPLEAIREKQAYLAARIKKRSIALKFHNPEMSLLEGAFARGDDTLGKVLEKALQLGCRFDGWTESFNFRLWSEAFRACGLDPGTYAYRNFQTGDPLPWDFVKTGVSTEFLQQEYRKAVSGEITGNCRAQCEGCGIGCAEGGTDALGKPSQPRVPAGPREDKAIEKQMVQGPEQTVRIRCRYTKTGKLRFLSHLDFMTLFQRAAVRARVPLAYSSGFNPHPKIAYGPALPVGITSEAEYLDMETDPFIDLTKMIELLNRALPPGIKILEWKFISHKTPSLSGSVGRHQYFVTIPDRYLPALDERVRNFLDAESIIVTKEGKERNIRPAIEEMRILQAGVEVLLLESNEVRARIQDVIQKLLETGQEEAALVPINRTGMYVSREGKWESPLSL